MSRRFFGTPHPPGSPNDEQSAPVAGRTVRWSLLGWFQAGLLAALVAALIVLTAEPTPHQEAAPAWAAPTGKPHGIRAVAPGARRLATGGAEGAVVL
jgi:hypothetical protein